VKKGRREEWCEGQNGFACCATGRDECKTGLLQNAPNGHIHKKREWRLVLARVVARDFRGGE